VNNNVKEIAQNFQEEEIEATKALIEIAGFDPYTTDSSIKENFIMEGFRMKRFKLDPLESFFVLSLKGEFVAGAIVSLNYELGQIKRTMIPHFNELDEKFHKFIKGMN
jgi:hypothetical protein